MKWRGSGTGIGAFSATADSIHDGALCGYGPRLRLPTSMPVAFYSERLGFKPDLRLQPHGRTYMGSVDVGDTVIMFGRRDAEGRQKVRRGSRIRKSTARKLETALVFSAAPKLNQSKTTKKRTPDTRVRRRARETHCTTRTRPMYGHGDSIASNVAARVLLRLQSKQQ